MAVATEISPDDLAELIERMDEGAAAYIRGDIRHYLSLFNHPEDYMLMPPYGGEAARGYAPTDEQVEETSHFFASGEARLDRRPTCPAIWRSWWLCLALLRHSEAHGGAATVGHDSVRGSGPDLTACCREGKRVSSA